MRKSKEKWIVYGEYGGTFTNLKDAKKCAKEVSKIESEASVVLLKDGCSYIDYKNGKCVRDGWIVKKKDKKILTEQDIKKEFQKDLEAMGNGNIKSYEHCLQNTIERLTKKIWWEVTTTNIFVCLLGAISDTDNFSYTLDCLLNTLASDTYEYLYL